MIRSKMVETRHEVGKLYEIFDEDENIICDFIIIDGEITYMKNKFNIEHNLFHNIINWDFVKESIGEIAIDYPNEFIEICSLLNDNGKTYFYLENVIKNAIRDLLELSLFYKDKYESLNNLYINKEYRLKLKKKN